MFVCLMVFNTTFNNISVISWRSVLLVEETGGPGENHWPVASHWQTWSHNVVHLVLIRFELTTSVMIGTDCIGSCKSNYHAIMATTAPCLGLDQPTCKLHCSKTGVEESPCQLAVVTLCWPHSSFISVW